MAHVLEQFGLKQSGPRVLIASLCLLSMLILLGCSGARRGGACCDPQPTCCPTTTTAQPDDVPPEAKPGEAWCRVWVPPVNRTLVETYCVCQQRCEQVAIPAEYGCRPKLVCVSPPKVREVIQPGVWTTEKRDVLVCGERESWKRVCCDKADLKPGEVQRECYTKQVCPPVWKQESVPVCIAEPKKCVKFTPAQHKLVDERYLLRPARCETRIIPAKFATRTKEICVTPGRWEWRRNVACEVPEEMLAALEVEMVDSDASGKEEGIFKVGSTVRYNLSIRSDEGGEAFPVIKVVFALPPQLEFISGSGEGVTVTGEGQSASSSAVQLPEQGEIMIFILARVLSAPETGFVQTNASIQDVNGAELVSETESTTLDVAAE